jgi:hypothetical protein
MKRIFLCAIAAVALSAGSLQAGCRQPLLPRLRAASQRLIVRPFVPVPQQAPQAMPTVTQAVFNRVSDTVRGLTLLPGSFGGCGPQGCPK